jgi:PAS domain S-box-containing protein
MNSHARMPPRRPQRGGRKPRAGALTPAERVLRAALEHLPEAAVIRDRRRRYQYFNLAARARLDRPVARCLGKRDEELWPGALAAPLPALLRAYRTGKPQRWEWRSPTADGGQAHLLVTHVPLEGRRGAVARVLSLTQDLTERRRGEEQLAFHADLLARVGDAVVSTDEAMRITFWNRAAEETFGWTAAEVLGRDARTLIKSEPEGLTVPEALSRLMTEGHFEGRVRYRRKDDAGIVTDVRSALLRGAGGEMKGVVTSFRDVTGQRRAEEALQESEEQYRACFELATFGAAQVEPATGRLLRVNDRYCEITGYSREELLTGNVRDLTHPEDREADWEKFMRMVRGETPEYCNQKRYLRKDGRTVWVLVSSRILRDRAGKPVRTVGLIMDVTERKRAEQALRAANARLIEADRRKNDFLAVLSHELRNPLLPIRNSLHVLDHLSAQSDPERRALAVIDHQVTQLSRLVDDLLDVTRIGRGKVRLQRERVDLVGLVRRVVEDHRLMFLDSGIALELQAGPAALAVNGDPERLAQVLGNLLQNANKFGPPGSRTTVSLRAARGQAELRVRDTGPGMSPELLAQLFEPFAQADQALDRSRGGLGLGLALVKALVQMHGGEVAAVSEGPGRGSEFTVRLPLDRARTPRRPPAPAPAPAPAALARRVLVIEDNLEAAESLKTVLELNAHVVEVASAGAEGIEKARSFRPEVVLCDIGLPGMDGYEVAQRIRADPRLRSVVMVALTGYALPEDIRRAKRAGFDRHLAKPPALLALWEAVGQGRSRRGRSGA